MGFQKKDLGDIANNLVPNSGDEAWVSDPDQQQHNHAGDSGDPHADGYYMYNDGDGPRYDKYHSD